MGIMLSKHGHHLIASCHTLNGLKTNLNFTTAVSSQLHTTVYTLHRVFQVFIAPLANNLEFTFAFIVKKNFSNACDYVDFV